MWRWAHISLQILIKKVYDYTLNTNTSVLKTKVTWNF